MDFERLYREERPRALATLIRLLRDFDLAEDVLQEAFAAAVGWSASPALKLPFATIPAVKALYSFISAAPSLPVCEAQSLSRP